MTPQELSAAIAAMKPLTGPIIHKAITDQVPEMFQAKAEGFVNQIEAQLIPVLAKAAIDAVDALRSKPAS